MADRFSKTYRKLFLVFLFPFLFLSNGNSQSYAINHFNIEEGLTGYTVYDIYQDALGYMWFGTDYGLCVFDGVEFKNYNSPLLANADVLVIKEMQGKIHFITLDQQLFCIQNDRIKKADPKIFDRPICDFIEDENNGLMWYVSKKRLFCYDFKKEKHTAFPYDIAFNFSKAINKTEDGIIWILTEQGMCKVNPQTGILETDENSHAFPAFNYPNARIISNNKIVIYGQSPSPYVFDGKNYKVLPTSLPFTKAEKIISMDFIDEEWWVSTNKRMHIIHSDYTSTNINPLLNNVLVNDIFSDRNGNIWLGTQNNGIYLINNLKIRNYTVSNSNLPANHIQEMTLGKDNDLWMGIEKGKISHFKENQFTNFEQESFSDKYYDLDFANEALYISANKVYKLYQNTIEQIRPFTSTKSVYVDDQYVWGASASLINRINIPEKKVDSFDENHRSYAIERLDENLWLGTIKGLFRIDPSPKLSYHYKKIVSEKSFLKHPSQGLFQDWKLQESWKPVGYFDSEEPILHRYYDSLGDSINDDIRQIAFTSDSTIWMSTNNAGLHYIKNDVIHHFNTNDGLVSNSCNDLFVDNDDNIWVATIKGLSKIEYPSLAYTNYTTDDGILSNWITSVVRSPDSTLYIGTNEGLSVVHQAHIRNSLSSIPIHFTNVKINEKDTILANHYDLGHNKNNLAIDFRGISFSSEVSYQYRLNKNWHTIHDHQIGLPELAPGNYDLEVRAVAANGAMSAAPIKLSIQINPPWWKTAWFICSIIFTSIVFILWWIAQIKKKEREKSAINKQFAELELQALQSQMNPHFVFNAMGAIQYFVLKKDQSKANHYLTNFSKLMRLFLDSSKEKYITLKDEITLLELYLKIEKLRFGEKLNYSINWDPSMHLYAIEIPSMLIQPFVENAINHGLIFKKSGGMLSIDFEMIDTSTICCKVIDNGIGRAEAKKRKSNSIKSYKSRATSIVESRLRTLNIIEDTNITIDINDRLDELGNVDGTIVEIINPILQ